MCCLSLQPMPRSFRLQPPDFHPVTIEINLASALAGDETVTLQQFDTVRIYGRYEVDAPTVAIYGDVLRPGEYPMSAGMTAAGLVKMAGGFKRSAFLDSASLASYVVENGQRVATDQQTMKIGAAMAGDPSADVRLKPGDALTILQIPGWSDIGRSVSIRGEVLYPGNYGVNEGERLSSLLKRVGGFRPAAYPSRRGAGKDGSSGASRERDVRNSSTGSRPRDRRFAYRRTPLERTRPT